MKVECAAPVAPTRRRLTGRAVVGLCVLAGVLGGLLTWAGASAKEAISEWAYDRGHHRFDKSTNFWGALFSIPGRAFGSVAAPHLVLDVKFKNMQKIFAKREEALSKGLLETGPGDLVPGRLSVDGKSCKIKLRLKGDYTDHLMGKKWSFRIQVSGDDHVLGMRRFSIQNPNTKGYHGEALFFACLRHLGAVAPRYRFAYVTLNGEDLGVMALEEHFSKELLESNGRRESVIIAFDETQMFHGLDDYRAVPVTAFRDGYIARSEALSRDKVTAVGLMRAFVDGTLAASQVFDVDELAGFLACAELWGTWHPIRWHNMRFYLDPITARLAPVGFDANMQQRRPLGTVVLLEEPIIRRMLADDVVFATYQRTLHRLCQDVKDGVLVDELRTVESASLPLLQKEFFLLEGFPFSDLLARAEVHLGLSAEALRTPGVVESHPMLVRAFLLDGAQDTTLELTAAVDHDVKVERLRWVSSDGSQTALFRPKGPLELPLTLPAAASTGPLRPVRIPCEAPPLSVDTVEVQVMLSGHDRRQTVRASAHHQPLDARPVPDSTVAEQLAQHAFLRLQDDDRTLLVAPGEWPVRGNLVVPSGYVLALQAGTRLQFSAGAALVAHGPLHFDGATDQPVVLEGRAGSDGKGSWQGLVVLDAGGPSNWLHVQVRDTTGIDFPLWKLTGGVTFYGSDVTLVDTQLLGTEAEDALNIVHAKFSLRGLRVERTASDAFDADFADGVVERCEFHAIGGDAVDISGSEIVVTDCRFTEVRDKALSVGEHSRMRASGVAVQRSGTGAACKDGSVLEISDATIAAPSFAGLAAYVKKAEYGPARITAQRLTYSGTAPRTRAQTGSVIAIDGREVPTEDIDVDALYQTIMRKDPR